MKCRLIFAAFTLLLLLNSLWAEGSVISRPSPSAGAR